MARQIPPSRIEGPISGSPAYIRRRHGRPVLRSDVWAVRERPGADRRAVRGLIALAWRRGPYRWLPAQFAFIALPYVLTVTHFAMWWGGYSSPARFLVPLLPSLAIPAAGAWVAAGERSGRGSWQRRWSSPAASPSCSAPSIAAASPTSIAATSTRLWAECASRTADLGHGLPAYFARVQRQRPGRALLTRDRGLGRAPSRPRARPCR